MTESHIYNFTYTSGDLAIDRCDYDPAFAAFMCPWLAEESRMAAAVMEPAMLDAGTMDAGTMEARTMEAGTDTGTMDAATMSFAASSLVVSEPLVKPSRIMTFDFWMERFTSRSVYKPGESFYWGTDYDYTLFGFELGPDGQPVSWSGEFWYSNSGDGFSFSSGGSALSFLPGVQTYDAYREMIDTRFFSTTPGKLTLNSVEYWCEIDDGSCDPIISAPIPASAPMLASAFGLLLLARRRWSQHRAA